MRSENKEAVRQRILTAPLVPLIITLAIPTMIGMMVSMIYNLTDTFWIGRLNDKSMTAAIGVAFSFVSFVQALGFWFGYGSGNSMSRALGGGDEEKAKSLSADGMALSIGLGLMLTVIGLPFARPLAAFLGANASGQLLEYTTVFLKIMLLAAPFLLFSSTAYNQLRLCGNAKAAMTGLLLGMLFNMILDPILILGFHADMAGAGFATLGGQVLSCIYFAVLSFRRGSISMNLRHVDFKNRQLYHILVGGAPNFTRQAITSIAALLLNQAAASYGEALIASLTISNRLASIGYLLMIGFSQSFQPICAMNFGARQYDRVKKAFHITVKMGTGILIIAGALLALTAPVLTGFFSRDLEVSTAAALILRLQCLSLPFLGFYAVSSMYMQNVGKYLCSLVISISRQGFFYIPLLLILCALWGRTGLYWLQPGADFLSIGFAAILFKKYKIGT